MNPLTNDGYSLTFDVDYPQQLSRWKTAFRPVSRVADPCPGLGKPRRARQI